MEMTTDHRAAPRNGHRSYKDSDAYRRSQRMRGDGQPIFPLPFAVKPSVPAPAPKRRPPRYGLLAALLACAAVVVVLERRR